MLTPAEKRWCRELDEARAATDGVRDTGAAEAEELDLLARRIHHAQWELVRRLPRRVRRAGKEPSFEGSPSRRPASIVGA